MAVVMTVDPALAVRGISKAFGGELALDDVSFTLARGEIHGLLGENGSGKSTLIKVLSGFHAPDSGELEVHGEQISLPLAPGQFRDLGLEFVHQDLGLIRSLTVTENLLVGDMVEPRRRWNWSSSRQHQKARETLERHNVDIDPTRQVGEFRPLEQAMIAIVRAVEGLRQGATADGQGVARRILVLDEPTVFLPRDGADVLFGLLNDVVSHGASVIFVSHKLSEVCQITDRFTVLRDGRVVGTERTADTDTRSIVRMIVGHDVESSRRQQSVATSTDAAVRVDRVAGDRLAPMSFDVRLGEIVGVTGLVGAGYEELPYLLFGVGPSRVGSIRVNGATYELARLDPARAIKAGIALVPADRKRDGGVLGLTVGENLTLPVLDRYTRGPFLSGRAMRREARPTLERFSVTPPDPTFLYSALSGGNQQKVLLAKWLQIAPKLLLLHEPTQGVDVGAREQLHALVREEAAAGMAVICVGSDHEQIALLCNRVLIVADGHVVDELTGDEITDQRITARCYTSTSLLSGEQAGAHALVAE